MDPDYEIFDLLVEKHEGGYRARVLSSPAGNETAVLQQPISEDQFQSFLFRVGRPRRVTRGVGASMAGETKTFGEELLRFLFPDRIWARLEQSKFAAEANGRGLRIQIRLSDVPELCDLPWEFLYHKDAGFLALSSQTPIVRFLEIRQPVMPLDLQHPLRILVLISSPSDLPHLNVDREWAKLCDAVSDIEARGLVKLERLDSPRLSRLNRRLRAEPVHILHFIGHGDFDDKASSGEIYLENEQGRALAVSAEQLAAALRDHRSIRLVVLNACDGARSSRSDPFAGTAQTLIRAGIPAVVAMQFEVTDDAAVTFASELYTSIALGDSVDRSLSEARKAIYLDGNELEWATPVLYLRSPDSRLFAVPHTNEIDEERARHGAARAAAAASFTEKVSGSEQVNQTEEKRKADEAARLAEQKAKDAEAERLAEQQRRAEEAQKDAYREAMERSRLEAEIERKNAEARRKTEEAARLAEAERIAQEAARKAQAQRKAEQVTAPAGGRHLDTKANTVIAIVLLVFFFPAGLIVMWKFTGWTKKTKWGVTLFFLVITLIWLSGKN